MTEELFDPGCEGLRLWASTDPNTRAGDAPGMRVPPPLAHDLVAAMREAAAKRAEFCLNVALLKWQKTSRDVPGLIDRPTAQDVLNMVEQAADALRVLQEIAVELFADDEEAPTDA